MTRAQVGAFSDKIEFSGTFTSDRDDLIGALKDLQFGNPTRLYDAIDASIDMLEDVSGRRRSCWSSPTATTPRAGKGQRDVLEKARAEEVMIYAIGLESEFFNGVSDDAAHAGRTAGCASSPTRRAAGTSS